MTGGKSTPGKNRDTEISEAESCLEKKRGTKERGQKQGGKKQRSQITGGKNTSGKNQKNR